MDSWVTIGELEDAVEADEGFVVARALFPTKKGRSGGHSYDSCLPISNVWAQQLYCSSV